MQVTLRTRGLALGLAIGLVLAATDVRATAQRTFVASTGVDAGACTLAQPCRSFGAAIAQADDGGEVVVLDSAGYGKFTVTKSVAVTAPAGIYAGISLSTGEFGVTIDAPGAIVVLRGLSINGLGSNIDGIHFVQGEELRVERCDVSGANMGVNADLSGGVTLYIRDSSFRSNFYGVSLHGAGHALLEHVQFLGNFNGISMDNLKDAGLRDVEIVQTVSQGIAISADAGDTTVTISRSQIDPGCAYALSAVASSVTIGVLISDTEVAGIECGSIFGVSANSSGTGVTRVSLVRDTFSGTGAAVTTAGAGSVVYLDGSLFVENHVTVGFSINAGGGPIYTRGNNTIWNTSASGNVLPYSAQ